MNKCILELFVSGVRFPDDSIHMYNIKLHISNLLWVGRAFTVWFGIFLPFILWQPLILRFYTFFFSTNISCICSVLCTLSVLLKSSEQADKRPAVKEFMLK